MLGLSVEGTFNARWASVRDSGSPWLARAAALDLLTPSGVAALSRLGISRVVDLREPSERGVPGHSVSVVRVPLYSLPGGPPDSGTLEEIYDFLLFERGPRLAAAVRAIAEATGPVLVHCAAGKDRTGLVVAIALEAAGVPRVEVLEDYAVSADEVGLHRREHAESAVARLQLEGVNRAEALRLHLESPASALERTLDALDRLGGASAYLLRNGMSRAQVSALRAKAEGGADVA